MERLSEHGLACAAGDAELEEGAADELVETFLFRDGDRIIYRAGETVLTFSVDTAGKTAAALHKLAGEIKGAPSSDST